MNSNFFGSASQAIHDVIIGMRRLAYKDTDPQMLARILDRADPLSAALQEGDNVTEARIVDFRLRLLDIEENFPGFEFLVAKSDRNMKIAKTKTAETKPTEAKPTEAKPTEAKPTEAKPTEAKRELAAVHA